MDNPTLQLQCLEQRTRKLKRWLRWSILPLANHLIELRSDDDGSRMTAVKDRQVVTQQPAVSKMSADTCEAYRSARSRVSKEQVMRDCLRRFTEAACTPLPGAAVNATFFLGPVRVGGQCG